MMSPPHVSGLDCVTPCHMLAAFAPAAGAPEVAPERLRLQLLEAVSSCQLRKQCFKQCLVASPVVMYQLSITACQLAAQAVNLEGLSHRCSSAMEVSQ
jgi:hypothetical protein